MWILYLFELQISYIQLILSQFISLMSNNPQQNSEQQKVPVVNSGNTLQNSYSNLFPGYSNTSTNPFQNISIPVTNQVQSQPYQFQMNQQIKSSSFGYNSDLNINSFGSTNPFQQNVPQSNPFQQNVPQSNPFQQNVPQSNPFQQNVPQSNPFQQNVPQSNPFQQNVPQSNPFQQNVPQSNPFQQNVPQSNPFQQNVQSFPIKPLFNPPQSQYNTNFYQPNFYAPLPAYQPHPINSLRLINKNDQIQQKKKIVGVIVTICAGTTYDALFTQQVQKSEQGTKVQVYACSNYDIKHIMDAFLEKSQNKMAIQLVKDITSIDPDGTVFNWQCSSEYSSKTFPQGRDLVMKFAKLLLDRGHMLMFSDFSLKALINEWDKSILGPKPFVFLPFEHSGHFQIRFDPKILKQCPSTQLQIVAGLSESGMCGLEALGGTIVYSLDYKNIDHKEYTLQLLSVVPNLQNIQNQICELGKHQGAAGHVLLTYPTGGKLLASMGHWIQLMKIDTTSEQLFKVAEQNYGKEYAEKMKYQYSNISDIQAQGMYVQQQAQFMVQSSAPCYNQAQKYSNSTDFFKNG